jgi:hypothetical protein
VVVVNNDSCFGFGEGQPSSWVLKTEKRLMFEEGPCLGLEQGRCLGFEKTKML